MCVVCTLQPTVLFILMKLYDVDFTINRVYFSPIYICFPYGFYDNLLFFFCCFRVCSSVVDLDLLAEHFVPGKKKYERVQWCLTDRLELAFDLLVAWEPPGK